jgi:hypothetical protein
VVLDENRVTPGSYEKGIPIWNSISLKPELEVGSNFCQIDYISCFDVVLVLEAPEHDGSVVVLSPRGKTGVVWEGHLRALSQDSCE